MYSLLLFIYIFSFNFQNVSILKKFGSITMIGEYYLLPVSLVVIIFTRKYKKNKVLVNYKNFFVYLLLLNSFVSILVLIFNKTSIYDENINLKNLHLLTGIGFQIITFIALGKILSFVNLNKIRKILNLNYLFLFNIAIIEKYIQLNNGRLKLTFAEPSAAGNYIIILGILLIHFNKGKLLKSGIALSIIWLSYCISSKGSILCFLLSILIVILLNWRRHKKLLILLFLLSSYFLPRILTILEIDIKFFTSVITRTWSILTAIISFILLPVGSGGGYLIVYSKIGEIMKQYLSTNFSFFNYGEINFMLKTGIALTPKSGFFFGILIAGVGYLNFSYKNFKFFYNYLREKKEVLLFLLIFFYLSNIFYSSEFQAPVQILIFSIFLKVLDQEEKI